MKRTLALLLALGVLAGCASRSVREPPAPLVELSSPARTKEMWTADAGSSGKQYVALVPALRDNTLYASDAAGHVTAYAADSGRRLWESEIPALISGATGVGDGLLVVGTRRGEVYALNRADGKSLWNVRVSSEVLAPPAVASELVVVQTIDGKVFGLSVKDGKRQWLYERSEPALSLRGTSAPLIVNDVVLAGFASGRLAALRLSDGKLLWEIPVTQPRGRNEIERLVDVDATPLVLGETVYAASYQGKVIALNPRTGSINWSRDISTYTGLASDARNLYVSDDKGVVYALDLGNGSTVWRQDKLHGRGLNAPAVYEDSVVVGDFEGYVHWLSREDGHLLARARVGDDPIRAPSLVAGDTLYVVGIGGRLSALRLRRD